ncbi:hypothetical protein JCM19047_4489 [Bacillus sp. JCM 19047]|nr:hypothetical protein JCM19047_4489 [Bacillus sp. JCM 19047]
MSTSLIRGFSIVTLALLFFFLGEIVVQANPISESRTIDRAFQYEGLKSKRAIQTFDYGNKNEVFVTQRVDATTILSRCEVSGATCNVKDYVELQNFGHGESLEVVKENGKTFIWIGNTANSEISQKWSTDVSLIEYKVNPSKATGAEVINVKTIKGLEKVAPNVKGKAYRTAVAIADDSNRMAFRVQIGPAAKDTYYAIYKTSEVTKALRNSPKNTLNIQDISTYN